jgi:hypothetical protein
MEAYPCNADGWAYGFGIECRIKFFRPASPVLDDFCWCEDDVNINYTV